MAASGDRVKYEDPQELGMEDDLPDGWDVRTMDDGRVYYVK